MRIVGDGSDKDKERGRAAIRTAIAQGYTQFDHADIYADGECEKLFGEILQDVLCDDPSMREKLILTSKCGIRHATKSSGISKPKRYDFSSDYLMKSVDGSLMRLGTEYLDLFLLHRPDYLADMQEIGEFFNILRKQGKVRNFGVSNFSASQVSLLQPYVSEPLLVNQIEINIHNIDALTNGILDQCQQLNITPQAWCPMGGVVYAAWGNTFSLEDECRIAAEFLRQANKYNVESWLIALAWLLKHPANICPIIGSTSAERIAMAKQALSLAYTREDWYALLEARNGVAVP